MRENIIIIGIIAVAVIAIAVPFIRRALRHRKIVGLGTLENDPEIVIVPEISPVEKERYLKRFIHRRRLPFRSTNSVWIRPEHHARIRSIIHSVGYGNVTITAYVDKVLEAHFEDTGNVVESLYEDNNPKQS